MTPDPAGSLAVQQPEIPSTAGMTTKVVKGSLWTLAGQVVPLAATLVSTPFVIRLLGSESYGVLILIGLIPAYLSFADFGMGIASTKFGSEAFGRGNGRREAEVIRTGALIAAASSLVVAIPLFVFSDRIVSALGAPAHLVAEASTGLRIMCASFVLGIVTTVINTPQLARLRMDLVSIVSAASRVGLAIATPIVLYLGGGIAGAAAASLFFSVTTFIITAVIARRLLPDLWGTTLDLSLAGPLARFGGGLVMAGIAGVLLVNFEKLALSRLVSVQALAYYSVAFTFANMTTLFSTAMIQSLVPAFSQLTAPEKRGEFDTLFERVVRINLVGILPLIAFFFVIAKPFFTLWAGEEFGRESTLPFYILLGAITISLLVFVPHSAITAFGHTQIHARLYWAELIPYVGLVVLLVWSNGIIGAALAGLIRACVDSTVYIWVARKVVGARFDLGGRALYIIPLIILLGVPVSIAIAAGPYSALPIGSLLICLCLYFPLIWRHLLAGEERRWCRDMLQVISTRLGLVGSGRTSTHI